MNIKEIYYELDMKDHDIVLCFNHAVQCIVLGATVNQMTSPYDDGLHSCDVCCKTVTLVWVKDAISGNS